VQHMKERGTISPNDDQLFIVTDSVEEAMSVLQERSIKRFALQHEKPFNWLFEKEYWANRKD
jgi:hypothetical protein